MMMNPLSAGLNSVQEDPLKMEDFGIWPPIKLNLVCSTLYSEQDFNFST